MRTVPFPLQLEGVLGVVFQEMLKSLSFVRHFSFCHSLISILSRLGSPLVLQQECEPSTCTADNCC